MYAPLKKEKGSRGEREARVCLSFNLTYFVLKVLKKQNWMNEGLLFNDKWPYNGVASIEATEAVDSVKKNNSKSKN